MVKYLISAAVLGFVCLILADSSKVVTFHQHDKIEDSINFLVIGDWGGLPTSPFTTEIEKAISKQMAKFVVHNNITFVLALGDNFYYDGVKDVHDARFQETYDHVFANKALDLDWYLLAGNHDHNGNVSAQIEYSNYEHRWKYPKYYYSLQMTDASKKISVDIIMLDTVILCGNSDHDFLGLQPSGPENESTAEDQWSWLESQLQASKADYLIVAGHYPVYSIGQHGPTKCLVKRLMPLLHKYSTTAYLCGHDHNLQHLEYEFNNSTVNYFISGAANFINGDTWHKSSVPSGSSKFFWGDITSLGGFGSVKITSSQMDFTFSDATGKPLHSQTIKPRRSK